MVEVLRCKPEGRGCDARRTMALGWTKPLTEMITRNISLEIKAAGLRADNLTARSLNLLSGPDKA